jgi:hypothetical protein
MLEIITLGSCLETGGILHKQFMDKRRKDRVYTVLGSFIEQKWYLPIYTHVRYKGSNRYKKLFLRFHLDDEFHKDLQVEAKELLAIKEQDS